MERPILTAVRDSGLDYAIAAVDGGIKPQDGVKWIFWGDCQVYPTRVVVSAPQNRKHQIRTNLAKKD